MAVLTCTHNVCFEPKCIRNQTRLFPVKVLIFASEKLCILHGQAFEMELSG